MKAIILILIALLLVLPADGQISAPEATAATATTTNAAVVAAAEENEDAIRINTEMLNVSLAPVPGSSANPPIIWKVTRNGAEGRITLLSIMSVRSN